MLEHAEYQIVSDDYRKFANRPKMKKNIHRLTEPLVRDLADGRTVLLNSRIKYGDKDSYQRAVRPYKRLYNHFNARGMRLKIHVIDDIDSDVFGGILMWAERDYKFWACVRCLKIVAHIGESRPQNQDCLAEPYLKHRWYEKNPDNLGKAFREHR